MGGSYDTDHRLSYVFVYLKGYANLPPAPTLGMRAVG